MPLVARNIEYVRKTDARLAECLKDLQDGVNAAALQAGVDAKGLLPAPPSIGELNITAANGIVSASITDNSGIYRAINYWLEWSLTPGFENPRLIFLGPSRTWDGALGNQTAYFRAYSQYPGSSNSTPVYFNGNAPIVLGGASPPPTTPSTGAGTGTNSGGTGSGTQPFRPQPFNPKIPPRLGTF
jgi:hypothetical protein